MKAILPSDICWRTVFMLLFTCKETKEKQPVYKDAPFLEEYSVKFYAKSDTTHLLKSGL